MIERASLLLFLCIALILPQPLAAQVPGVLQDSGVAVSQSADGEIVLHPGDKIQITVFRQPEMSGEFTVASDGSINHPLYQAVNVAGVPLATVRERLHAFLKGWETEPYFRVTPLLSVAVGGEVEKPNLYTFPPEMTIAQAVATAGGVTDRGRLNRVRVLHRDGTQATVDLTNPTVDGALMPVHSGDQIFVERNAAATFREYIAPAGSLAVAFVSLISILLR